MKFNFYLALGFILFSLQSCDTDVDVLAPYEDISVVYGLIDEDSTRQYIKINKLYQTLSDANTAASDREDQEYTALVGTVSEINASGDVINEYQLVETEDIAKDSGLFYYPNQTLYYFDATINASNTYELNFINEEGDEVNATTNIVGKNDFPIDELKSPNSQLAFVTSTGSINDNFSLTVFSGDNAASFEMYLTFKYRDKYYDDTYSDVQTVEVSVGNYEFDGDEQEIIYYNAEVFFNRIINTVQDISETPDVKVRVPLDTCIQVNLSYANEDLMYYMMVNEPSTSLIEEKPEYTNIDDGLGIFASRTFWNSNYRFNTYTHSFLAGEFDPTKISDEGTLEILNALTAKGFCDNLGNPSGCN